MEKEKRQSVIDDVLGVPKRIGSFLLGSSVEYASKEISTRASIMGTRKEKLLKELARLLKEAVSKSK